MFKPIRIAAVCFLVVVSASGTTFVMPTDDEMIAKSPAIVTGTVEGSFVRESDRQLETVYEVRITKTYKGSLPEGRLVQIVAPGGVLGDRAMIVHATAQLAQGERVLLFL